jgi:hypothetical protein
LRGKKHNNSFSSSKSFCSTLDSRQQALCKQLHSFSPHTTTHTHTAKQPNNHTTPQPQPHHNQTNTHHNKSDITALYYHTRVW